MQVGGSIQTAEAVRAIRIINVFMAPLASLYALLVMGGVLPETHPIDMLGTTIILYIWIGISVYYYFHQIESRSDRALRIVTYHAFLLTLYTSTLGFAHPFVLMYIVLLVEAYLFFGKIGAGLSLIAFVGAAFQNSVLWTLSDQAATVESVMAVLSVALIGVAIVRVISAQEISRQTLVRSQQRERLQYDRMLTIINNLSEASFTTDEKGNVLLYNAACLNLLDTNDDLKGRAIADLFKLSDKDGAAVNLFDILQAASRTTTRDDLQHAYNDGESIRLELTFSPIRSSYSVSKKQSRLGGYIVMARDVTKQKSLEEQRDEFISVVSHELRTPITIVEGTLSNLDLLLKRPQAPSPKVISDTVTTAHEQTLYLARMVNDLSTLSRAERGVADTPEQIDVAELLQAMHKQYERDATARKLHLNLELGTKLGTVNVSRLYLEELLQNFITNGIKYTQTGSVTIIGKRTGKKVLFAVKDTGIGISRSDQQKVFHKFYRSEDYRIRETNGTGLGLYVAAQLSKKLKTQIELKSRLNHGSTFSFELEGE